MDGTGAMPARFTIQTRLGTQDVVNAITAVVNVRAIVCGIPYKSTSVQLHFGIVIVRSPTRHAHLYCQATLATVARNLGTLSHDRSL